MPFRPAETRKSDALPKATLIVSSFVAATIFAASAVHSPVAYSQVTSSAAAGQVVDPEGNAVAGLAVELLHAPSGTVSRSVTDANGRFNFRGVRVGGPYRVTVRGEGYKTAVLENQFLQLGDTGNIIVGVEPSELAEVLVAATRIGGGIFDATRTGAGSQVSSEQIASLPSISRNIQDLVRTDPRIAQTDKERGEISAGGQNTRFNNIRIDGVSTNDGFGLESNNLPTDRQPISIDSIESINIALADFDVARSGYTGASINAVTKSGTNEFKGSGYFITRDSEWTGSRNGSKFKGFQKEETLGATLGGPIIQDKLFFFASYENFERAALAPTFGPVGSGAAQIVNGITTAQIAQIQQIAKDVWKFDAGSFEPPGSLDSKTEDMLIKFDWNISEGQRASLRLNKTEQKDPFLRNINQSELSLSSYWQTSIKEFESAVVQLYSDWTPSLSSEISGSYSSQKANWDIGTPLPQVRICLNSATCSGAQSVYIGSERFRHVNVLEVDAINLFAAGTYVWGDHATKFGIEYQSQDIFNLFGRDQFGVYEFYGIEAFRQGTPGTYSLFYPTQGGVETRAAAWKLQNLAGFIQDTWEISPKLTVTAGVRIDMPIVDDKPVFNATASNLVGLRNDATIDGNLLVQPRVSFNFRPEFERRTQIRGGVGLFQGIAANVWLSNPFSNNSVTAGAISLTNPTQVAAAGVRFSADPNNQPGSRPPPGQGGIVDFVDPDLQLPAAWKGSFAIDHELPWYGIVASAEVVLTEVEEGIRYIKPNLGAVRGTLPDGRPHYWSSVATGAAGATFPQSPARVQTAGASSLINRDSTIAVPTGKGDGKQVTFSLQGTMGSYLFWNVGYTFTEATEVNTLTSSQAASNWNNAIRADRNADIAERSVYAIQDRFTANLNFRKPLIADLITSVGMFYEGRSGKPYTFTFVNDVNGDARSGVDPFYVPKGPGDVLFTGGAAMETAFLNYLNSNPDLAKYAGRIATVNGTSAPWVNNIDLRLSQEIPALFGAKGEVWIDILNFGNMLNSDWGRIEEVGFPGGFGVARFAGVDTASGKYVYDFRQADVRDLTLRDNRGESRWAAQLGIKFKF